MLKNYLKFIRIRSCLDPKLFFPDPDISISFGSDRIHNTAFISLFSRGTWTSIYCFISRPFSLFLPFTIPCIRISFDLFPNCTIHIAFRAPLPLPGLCCRHFLQYRPEGLPTAPPTNPTPFEIVVEILAKFLPVIVVQLASGPVPVQYFLLVETRYRLRKKIVCLFVYMWS